MKERIPEPEHEISTKEVLEAYRLSIPEAQELMVKWMLQKERKLRGIEDEIAYKIELAKLSAACGLGEQAILELEEALNLARQGGGSRKIREIQSLPR